nr:hypothetical protein [Sphingobacterium daejeonense]
MKDTEEGNINEEGLLVAETERGICKVFAFYSKA